MLLDDSTHSKAVLVPLPSDSGLRDSLPQANYEDAFSRNLKVPPDTTAADLLMKLKLNCPLALRWLLKTKEFLLTPFGFSQLKEDNFDTVKNTPDEIILAFEDRSFLAHLALSIHRKKGQVILSSRVFFRKPLGKFYVRGIQPFHQAVFKLLLNSL